MQEYLNNMFKKIDENIILDEDQKKIITTDDKYMMVIAGAGSGKTTTISAKVNYLIEKQNTKDEEILIISFTNKAVEELKNRINNDFKHKVNIMTFHKFGYEIIKQNTKKIPTIVKDNKKIVKEYIEKELINNKKKLEQFLDLFIYYFDIDEKIMLFKNFDKYYKYKNNQKYPTLKQKLEYINENTTTIDETKIANYLYINNIEYEYKKPYKHNKSYRPDFTIYHNNQTYYIEYFNINKINKFKYKKGIKAIEKIHKKYSTILIKIYEDDIIESLNQKLENIVTKKNINEIFEKLIMKNKGEEYKKFIEFCTNYIMLFKGKGYKVEDFSRLNDSKKRNKKFIEFMKDLYIYYEKHLIKTNQIDFDDMINKANEIVKEQETIKLKYKYIIIDEYQDISESRFELIKNISNKINCHIMVVGDDWQCIYSFASSNINLFTNFKKIVGKCTTLKIIKTYRNSQQLIDIAGRFITKNKNQIEKKLISPKQLKNPVKILIYKNIEEALEESITYLDNKYKEKSILILGRYTFDKNKIIGKKFKEEKNKITYKNKKIDYMTVHASKGLGYDNVIIINALNDTLGFPTKIKTDPIIQQLITSDENIKYAEERRLFYVALTRTKNEVIILSPNYNPSVFIKEIKKYKGVKKYKRLRMIK